MKKHIKMPITICLAMLLPFLCGLFGTWGYFCWEMFIPLTGLSVLGIFFVVLIKLIVSAIKKKPLKDNLITTLLALLLLYTFAYQSRISFYGTTIHYKLLNSDNYKNIRDWVKTIEIEEDERFFLHWQQDEFPYCIAQFNPMYVYVNEQNNEKATYLTWSSGLMAYELRLTIAPVDMEQSEIEFPEKTFLFAKIRDGVYLSRNTF